MQYTTNLPSNVSHGLYFTNDSYALLIILNYNCGLSFDKRNIISLIRYFSFCFIFAFWQFLKNFHTIYYARSLLNFKKPFDAIIAPHRLKK